MICFRFRYSKGNGWLFVLFYHQFGMRCLRIVRSNVVSSIKSWAVGRIKGQLWQFCKRHLPKFRTKITETIFSNRATLLIIPWNCCRLPFDYKSPVGYTLAIFVQYFAVYMPLRYIECFMCFGVAIFLFSLSLAKDIGIFVESIDKNAKAKKHRTIIYKQLCKTIQFTDLKRLVNLFDFLCILLSCTLCSI